MSVRMSATLDHRRLPESDIDRDCGGLDVAGISG